jgi:hypothetical protein
MPETPDGGWHLDDAQENPYAKKPTPAQDDHEGDDDE